MSNLNIGTDPSTGYVTAAEKELTARDLARLEAIMREVADKDQITRTVARYTFFQAVVHANLTYKLDAVGRYLNVKWGDTKLCDRSFSVVFTDDDALDSTLQMILREYDANAKFAKAMDAQDWGKLMPKWRKRLNPPSAQPHAVRGTMPKAVRATSDASRSKPGQFGRQPSVTNGELFL